MKKGKQNSKLKRFYSFSFSMKFFTLRHWLLVKNYSKNLKKSGFDFSRANNVHSNFFLHIIYRISDKGNPKPKLKSKEECLKNCLSVFHPFLQQLDFTIVCNETNSETNVFVQNLVLAFGLKQDCIKIVHLKTNQDSFFYCLDLLDDFQGSDYVYFVEDDYFHSKDSFTALKEAFLTLPIKPDYVSLTDQPNWYSQKTFESYKSFANSNIFLSQSSHWRTVNSFTTEFASRVETIREDQKYFRKWGGKIGSWDYYSFCDLQFFHKRILVSPLPSLATHCDLDNLSPFISFTNE